MIKFLGTDRAMHSRIAAISPSEDVAIGTWKLGDNLPNGDDIALTSIPVGAGFTGTYDITLVRPASSTGDSSVRLFRRYKDAAGTMLDSDQTGTLTITTTPNDYSISLDPAPAGTTQLEIGLLSKMNPPGDPVRINKFQDPRAANVANFYTRYSWGLAAYNTAGTPVTGLTTYVRVNCTSSDTGTGRGINLYESTDRSSPLGNAGYPCTGLAGSTITISAYVYATKAATFQLSARGYAGTTWKGSATSGSSVAVAANTWTRLSVSYTVASGATDLCVTAMTTNSVAWVSGDYIGMTMILFEDGSSLNPYFDGTSVQLVTPPASSVWAGNTNNSNSLLWAATTPGGTTVQATDSTLSYESQCLELIGVSLESDFRRSVADIFNSEESLITAGTPSLLSGRLTFLCDSLGQAYSVKSVYELPGLVTLSAPPTLTEVRRNLIQNPRGTGVVAGWSLNNQWAGSGGSINVTTENTAVTLPDGTSLPSFRRKTWTVTPSVGEFIAWQFYSSSGNRGAVTAGQTYTVQYAWRKSFAGTVTANRFQVLFYDAASGGNQVGTTINGTTLNNPAPGIWQRDSFTFTVPAGATHCAVAHIYNISDPAILVPGVTFDATAALAEASPSAGKYFDGGYSPDSDLSPAWVGSANASESTLTATTNINELDGLTHRAVERAQMEGLSLSGKDPYWTLGIEFREQV